MISRFFIDRPIFAAVLSMLIFLVGIVSINFLPIARFPEITPPTVQIRASYPGANAETVAEALAGPIEQELSGTDDLVYFQSYSGNDGALNITATFEIGTDLDLAAVEVQNRVKRAEPRLPQESLRQGITVNKASTSMLMVASLKSNDEKHDGLFLSNYASIYMLDRIKRVNGVGDAQVFGGQDYAMRVWIDPFLLASKGLTVSDVSAAIREENGLYASGRIGASPSEDGTQFTIPVVTRGRLQTPEEFEDIVLRANSDGSFIYLADVARVELSSQGFDLVGRQDGVPTTFILIYLQSGANALETVQGVNAQLDEMKASFPAGMYYEVPYNTTPFIRIAIEEVVKTFAEAIGLVALVVLLFLGNWRASLIPMLAVPVAIVGTFTGMMVLGFSINSLTLFGLVLAIGIVVDDAIIVVENVERIMHTEHLDAREATIRAMEQVTGPIIAIVLVLGSVFVPVGFLGGLTGEMYQQFAITIAVSVFISGLVALTLSPALCAVLLQHEPKKMILFRWFDYLFAKFTAGYAVVIRQTIRWGVLTMMLFGIMLFATWRLFEKMPSGFIPQEDQGFFICVVMLPPGSSMERTTALLQKVEDFMKLQPEVAHVATLAGIDFLAGGSASTSTGIMFVPLKPWDQRPGHEHSVENLVGRTFMQFANEKDGFVLALNPPPVQGLGLRAGFEFQLESRGGGDTAELAGVMQKLLAAASQRPELSQVNGTLNVSLPQLHLALDRKRAKLEGVSVTQVYDTLQALLGSLYVNDFVKYGRTYRVQLQAEPRWRSDPGIIEKYYVRNNKGMMIPMSGLVSTNFQSGPSVVSRFNSYPSVQITGAPTPGYSTGDAIRVMEELAKTTLPQGYGFEWSGSSYQEIQAGSQAPYILGLGLVVVFLVLAAQYERWSLPVAVLLGIPSGTFGAILAIYLRRNFGANGIDDAFSKDIYFQIGLLTLIGLAAKNAILIVEFSSSLHESGRGIVQAAVEAARVRLRPFIMTSMAFVLGVLPLAISEGAGAAGRRSIGTGVIGGMLAATFLDMFFVPLFFVIVQWCSEKLSRNKPHHRKRGGADHPPSFTCETGEFEKVEEITEVPGVAREATHGTT